MKWLKRILGIKDPVQPPVAGERWMLDTDQGPWPRSSDCVVTVLDCLDGWVRYDMGGTIFRDERMRLDSFLYCYRRCA